MLKQPQGKVEGISNSCLRFKGCVGFHGLRLFFFPPASALPICLAPVNHLQTGERAQKKRLARLSPDAAGLCWLTPAALHCAALRHLSVCLSVCLHRGDRQTDAQSEATGGEAVPSIELQTCPIQNTVGSKMRLKSGFIRAVKRRRVDDGVIRLGARAAACATDREREADATKWRDR